METSAWKGSGVRRAVCPARVGVEVGRNSVAYARHTLPIPFVYGTFARGLIAHTSHGTVLSVVIMLNALSKNNEPHLAI